VKVFIDTSVLLAAAGSENGESSFLFEQAPIRGWVLITTHYCLEEAQRNVAKVGRKASTTLNESLLRQRQMFPSSDDN